VRRRLWQIGTQRKGDKDFQKAVGEEEECEEYGGSMLLFQSR
jgi:hypothetical protein